MRDPGRTIPPRNETSRVGDGSRRRRDAEDGDVAAAASRIRQLPVRPMGLFQHPNDWTDEEINTIVDCLKANIPIYRIAKYVNCERHALSRLIEKRPELRQLKEEQRENIYQEAVFQADKLAKLGNASIIMFILERLGKKVWSQQQMDDDEKTESGRIVMGIIPPEDVKAADEKVETLRAEGGGVVFESDPVKLAAMQEEAAKEAEDEKARQERLRQRKLEADIAAGRVVDVAAKGERDEYAEQVLAPETENYGMYGGGGGYDGMMGGGAEDAMAMSDGGGMWYQ